MYEFATITVKLLYIYTFLGGFFISSYFIQHCFICRPSDFPVPTDVGIEPMDRCNWCIDSQTLYPLG
jgi:hypothetical protein